MSTKSKKFEVLVTHPEFPKAALNLLQEKCEVKMCCKVPSDRSEILTKSQGVDGIVWATHDMLNAEALDAAGSNLKAISTMSAGLDHVDIPEVRRRDIKLGHTPGVLNEAVADVAIGLMIAAARRFHDGRKKIETSTWENWHIQWMLGQEIACSTVGFVGFGRIAQAIARRLKGFNVGKIIYYNRGGGSSEDCEHNAVYVKFEELLKQSDIVFIACPLTPETNEMFNEQVFNQMKSNCVLINIARGQIVKQKDLYNALKNGKIFSAGLDVMTPEPLPKNDPLLSLPNCVIIPHLGSATYKTREQMGILAAQNVIKGMMNVEMISPAY